MAAVNTGKYRPEKSEKKKVLFEIDDSYDTRIRPVLENDEIDEKYGFKRVTDHQERTGFLINMHSNEIFDENKKLNACVDYYFIQENGNRFKVSLAYKPYFYILVPKENIQEITQFLQKKYGGLISNIDRVLKEDLDLPNHLIGLKQRYLKLTFTNQSDMTKIKREILSYVRKNEAQKQSNTFYTEMITNTTKDDDVASVQNTATNHMENIIDIREYDVPYHVRVSTDLKIFCGSWYSIKTHGAGLEPLPVIKKREDLIERPEQVVLAFDIETTKLPLKFPDAATDQIMMISYMIDGGGYLIINRAIVSSDVNNFDYSPKPEFEGVFQVFNEPNEKALIVKFFMHIIEARPHIFVTYNGDFFDWPFIETRAAVHGIDMKQQIGFSLGVDGVYLCRPAIHMDCLCWVKRDSYLPVGSQNLKAVAKAKLRYDPVELEPEDMCRLAADEPSVLANYSVSDAVATYYLYMKYVHPFIFALCTIIPCEPDEVLRKGSGTLCEALLMVEAFHGNIIFPNKQRAHLNKTTDDGHLLHQETYVGGHVEALESGVFRADIPCRFRLVPSAFDKLIGNLDKTLKHAIEVEQGVPVEDVCNYEEVKQEIVAKLEALRDHPHRMENPIIYHLDVAAMYPNIILTNRLQPCAIVNESICAACDFNKPGARCQRDMQWMWRAEYMPATRNELQRIQQQLEMEKFPPKYPGGPQRAYHELTAEQQAEYEATRLSEYCRKAYKKVKVTKTAERTTTICQKENSFYVDTVRAFRDRRYEYKAMNKKAKQAVAAALVSGNAAEIKSAKNREVLYDSLQLAHKCILNSFYGYVMRRGARWHSMEMAGIVCYTGAHIIMKTREIIEQIGRPLELDTDGIWCVLPVSFPENFQLKLNNKKTITISYPNAILNEMVKEQFTNDQYHDLIDTDRLEYKIHDENSIFFEVDGPYLAMVLPASKEEGKKLKKRYAVFNFDGSLAELKGFEVKRRGELQLIKIFQSSVFNAFLKGDTLETCYASVAQIANYWLDILYSEGEKLTDTELFDLISENRSMSKKLEEYGAQKSTSISTAKRLAEFLGDEMIKDKGLACKFIISRKPDGAPVTERAIPLAIFQTEHSVQHFYLRKWLKDNTITDFNIRNILDWNYYIERLGGTIQKIITIPAAMQGLANPVPRVKHPDWLHKKVLEKEDLFKQRKISDMFQIKQKPILNEHEEPDIEDILSENTLRAPVPIATYNKRKRSNSDDKENNEQLSKSWKEVLGPPPPIGTTKEQIVEWIVFQKKKWDWQSKQRLQYTQQLKKSKQHQHQQNDSTNVVRNVTTLGGFLKRAQRTLLDSPWQIIQIAKTNTPGEFKLWCLVANELHNVKLIVPRVFYVNLRKPRELEEHANAETNIVWRKCNRILPRLKPVYFLYKYCVPEELYIKHGHNMDLPESIIEGIYETQISLMFRALLDIGCICRVNRETLKHPQYRQQNDNTFQLEQLRFESIARQPYLSAQKGCTIQHIYMYHHKAITGAREMYGLFLNPLNKALIIVIDSVRTNLMPNMNNLYAAEHQVKLEQLKEAELIIPNANISFDVRIETDHRQVYRNIQRALQNYRDEKKGATYIAIQTNGSVRNLQTSMPELSDFPQVQIHVQDIETLYNTLEWQRNGAKVMVRHYLNSEKVLQLMLEQSRYFHVPLGNIPADPTLFGADLFYARHLQNNNVVLWCSKTDKPDLGGSERNDASLFLGGLSELFQSDKQQNVNRNVLCNQAGAYSSVCVELDIDSLAISTLLQSHHINDIEGTNSTNINYSNTIDNMMSNEKNEKGSGSTSTYNNDDIVLSSEQFRILKHMVNEWLRDISIYRNIFADFQIVHFYRWLRSPSALLYEPAILKTLENLMRKLFIQLVGEFKRLGGVIVYANFNKIIICTKKTRIPDALSHVEFIVKSIRNKELFHTIEITFNQCWTYLLWLNLANHGGVQGKLPNQLNIDELRIQQSQQQQQQQQQQQDNNEDSSIIIMNWNLMEYLPEEHGCRKSFKMAIAGYISAIYSFIHKEHTTNTQTNQDNDSLSESKINASQSANALLGVAINTSVMEYAQKLISEEMSLKLFEITEKIYEKVRPTETIENPSLEFIKIICHILALDPALEDVVYKLKQNMLQLINISEFSDEAVFRDPSVSYILPGFICKSCNHCRDIDLGRDHHQNIQQNIKSWFCPICKNNYENDEIEYLLVDALNRKMISYNLQDLQCQKCGQIKMEYLPSYCSCAGHFNCLISEDHQLKILQVFHKIASTFNMIILKETIHYMFQYSS